MGDTVTLHRCQMSRQYHKYAILYFIYFNKKMKASKFTFLQRNTSFSQIGPKSSAITGADM